MKVKSVTINDTRLFWYKKYNLYLKIYQRLTIHKNGKVVLFTSLPSKDWEKWAEQDIIENFRISRDAAAKMCRKLTKASHNANRLEIQSGWDMRIEYADAESEVYVFRHDHAAEELSNYLRKMLNRYDLFVPCTGGNYIENTKVRNAAFRIIKERASRLITLSLRHKPHVIGIALDEYGWADVEDLFACMEKTGLTLTRELLEDIVKTDKKRTFSFNEDRTKIRVNKNHSFPVKAIADSNLFLERKSL